MDESPRSPVSLQSPGCGPSNNHSTSRTWFIVGFLDYSSFQCVYAPNLVGIVEKRHARTCRHIHDHSCHTVRNEVENEPHLKQSSPVSPSTAMPRLRPRSPIFTWKLRKFCDACWLSDQTTGCYCHLFSLSSWCVSPVVVGCSWILELPGQGGALPCSWKRLLRLQADKNVRRFQVLQ